MTAYEDILANIPPHLKKYVVDQNYERYNSTDQAVWRYTLRQLKDFLSIHAHACYLEGLEKTGISERQIPHISKISEKLNEFGWAGVPVSGFIPPAAFMEMQSLGFLPIASDMRTLEHLLYTPAPDIVHEAAGHAPIIIDNGFASYLKQYAQVAKKAIISKKDLNQYEAIRDLSDLKEDSHSTSEDKLAAEQKLHLVNSEISDISEAGLLSRMNWWTAEYGLIGSLKKPKIYGAGLLSSISESRECLSDKVKKLPLTLECLTYTYDITEPQPQLFVTESFENLTDVLNEMTRDMAFTRGGLFGLERAKSSEVVNTIELNNGLQISGLLNNFFQDASNISYLQFSGPCQLSYGSHQLEGHSPLEHLQGFGTALGLLKDNTHLSGLTPLSLSEKGILVGRRCELHFKSGISVKGSLKSSTFIEAKLIILSFVDCTVSRDGQILFDPSWGTYDMAVGEEVTSVYGGPADRIAFGDSDDFKAKIIGRKTYSQLETQRHELYQKVIQLRAQPDQSAAESIVNELKAQQNTDWLLWVDLLEIAIKSNFSSAFLNSVKTELESYKDPTIKMLIDDGLRIANN